MWLKLHIDYLFNELDIRYLQTGYLELKKFRYTMYMKNLR